jgi:hypothetical protein
MAYFKVVTNYRTFNVEASGIGDAIDRVLNLLLIDGEYVREITDAPAQAIAA